MGAGFFNGLFISLAILFVFIEVLFDDLLVLLVELVHECLLELLLLVLSLFFQDRIIFEFLHFFLLLFFAGLFFLFLLDLAFLVQLDSFIIFAVKGKDYQRANQTYNDSDHL